MKFSNFIINKKYTYIYVINLLLINMNKYLFLNATKIKNRKDNNQ